MYVVISELDPISSADVGKIWRKLHEACGLKKIYTIPVPHFTWFASDSLDVSSSALMLSKLTANAKPLSIHTFGLGLFTGEHPVLYLPMVKSEEMLRLHREIWDLAVPYCEGPKHYYSPAFWIPHITLALKDLTRENIACGLNKIAFETIEYYVTIDSLSIAEYVDKSLGKTYEKIEFNESINDHME